MLPASQDVRSDRFATGESSCPDFLQFATNAVSYLAAGTSFFIAIIILSRRMAGGLASQPSILCVTPCSPCWEWSHSRCKQLQGQNGALPCGGW